MEIKIHETDVRKPTFGELKNGELFTFYVVYESRTYLFVKHSVSNAWRIGCNSSCVFSPETQITPISKIEIYT